MKINENIHDPAQYIVFDFISFIQIVVIIMTFIYNGIRVVFLIFYWRN